MKFTSSALVLAAAIGVSAHPSGHAHLHGVRHNLPRDFVVANKPVVVTQVVTVPAVAAPTAVAPTANANAVAPSSAAASSATPAASKAPSSGAGFVPFCGGKKSKRATLAEIAYKGNVGVEGNYGCNMMVVDSAAASSYDHIVTFQNSASAPQECVCWNKIGPDGGINGFFKGNQALKFTLPGSGSTVVAVDVNSQGGCACGTGSVPLTSFGQFASTWLEFDMANQSNGGWSGADASCLVSAAQGLNIPPMKVCGHGTCSTIYQGGKGENAYLGGMEALDGIGLNLPAGKVSLTVTV